MRCSCFCTASLYRTNTLAEFLKTEGYTPTIYENVIHIEEKTKGKPADIFLFPYGVIAIWGLEHDDEEQIVKLVKDYETEPVITIAEDYATYLTGEKTYINEEQDEIILENDDMLVKLSISYGLAQSVKLSAFEDSILRTIERTRHIPEELVEKGRISLSRKELSKQLGALFAERNSVNLHSDILGTPEFFWRRPTYEPYYHMAAGYMDITTRLDILNRRLDVIHELYGVVSNEINHIHSSRLELTIIYLIVIEVVLVLIKDFLKWI
jgi:uncharacterized Rmd1/YagE family protein